MPWTFHRRAEILRAVVAASEQRLDGRLPMDVEGVAETFGTEETLLGALQLRWFTALSGRVEHQVDLAAASGSDDLEAAVLEGWRETARTLAGVRRILDAHRAAPTSPAMADAIAKALAKEHQLLAVLAGVAVGSPAAPDPRAVRAGRDLEARARQLPVARRSDSHEPPTLLRRLKAVLAA